MPETDEMVKTAWTSFALTHVEYPEGDLVGKFLAFSSLIPFIIIVGFITLILFRRDLHTITFFGGLLINEITNFILKSVIKESRPIRDRVLFNEYGMPSSHSQLMWYYTTYTACFLFLRLPSSNFNAQEFIWKIVTLVGTVLSAVLVTVSRVYLEYHSLNQVFWGAIIGSAFGIVWFIVTQLVFTPLFPIIASWPISEFLMIRDLTLIPNVLWFEYTVNRSEARTRSRKLTSMKSQ